MNDAVLAGLQAAIIVLAILLILATLQDLSGRSDVISVGIEQLFHRAIELLTLALYRIFEREILYRLSRRGTRQNEPTERDDGQQGTPSGHLRK